MVRNKLTSTTFLCSRFGLLACGTLLLLIANGCQERSSANSAPGVGQVGQVSTESAAEQSSAASTALDVSAQKPAESAEGTAKPGIAGEGQVDASEPVSEAPSPDAAATTDPIGATRADEARISSASDATASTAKPAKPEAAPAASSAKKSGRIQDITFDDIKFEMEKSDPFKRSMLTPEIEKLVGAPIRIRGYILPASVFSQTGFSRFILVRDNQECCFGPGAALYDAIVVEMEPGKTADYNIFPIALEGTFSIKEMKGPGGKHLAIYHVLGSAVK